MGSDFSRTIGSIRALALISVLAWMGCSAPPGSPDAEGAAPPPVASPGPVIAVVNGAPIHERQFENAWSVERARLEGEGEELTPEKWLERRQATLRLRSPSSCASPARNSPRTRRSRNTSALRA